MVPVVMVSAFVVSAALSVIVSVLSPLLMVKAAKVPSALSGPAPSMVMAEVPTVPEQDTEPATVVAKEVVNVPLRAIVKLPLISREVLPTKIPLVSVMSFVTVTPAEAVRLAKRSPKFCCML